MDVYETSDLGEAILLKYFDHKLQCVDKTKRRAEFSFERQPGTDELIRNYREKVLRVDPYIYYQTIREVKDRLYNG